MEAEEARRIGDYSRHVQRKKVYFLDLGMTKEELVRICNDMPDELVKAVARKRLITFSRYMQPTMEFAPFHTVYYTLLDMFAHGKIKKMIVQIAPQSGKSEGSSRKLPAFMLGVNPDLKICIGSYSTTIANDFNRDVQRIIDSKEYRDIFPNVLLIGSGVNMPTTYVRNSDVFEIVGHKGSLRVVGRGGSLTSKTVDISILDDVYKDYAEGNSPVIRDAAWKWYTTVVRTRLHNNSQELIVFTRWHEDDLIGRLEKSGEQIIDVTKWSDLDNIPKGAWVRINFEGLKESEPTEIDPRQRGEALWEERHSKEKLEAQKKLDPVQFNAYFKETQAAQPGVCIDLSRRGQKNRNGESIYVRVAMLT